MNRKAMRSVLLLILAFALLSGCGSAPRPNEAVEVSAVTAEPEPSAEPSPAEEPDDEPAASEPELGMDTTPEGPRVAVVVFSGTGHTRRIAQGIADALGTELREIVPAEPYTEEDLNYSDSSTRATVEQNDPAARPAIAEPIDGLDDCDVLFLGYPIWWGQEPRILDTFVEMYDLTGITVAPFCTSGSSGIGTSVRQLSELAAGADWKEGLRFDTDASEEEINNWAAEMLDAAIG